MATPDFTTDRNLRTCQQCGKQFRRRGARGKLAKYCSDACKGIAYQTGTMHTCQRCGKEFFYADHKDRPEGRKYCSMDCYRPHHGESGTRLHGIWVGMKARCNNPKTVRYNRYGGRGITVCPEWLGSYLAFRDWANANGYAENLSIERIDVDGHYCPENCRWASDTEQRENRGNTRYLEAFGERKAASAWLRDPRCVATKKVLYHRIWAGWDTEKALTTPTDTKYARYGHAAP